MDLDQIIEQAVAAVPGLSSNRVFPLEGLQRADPPFVLYIRQSNLAQETLDGDCELRSRRYEINCVAASYGGLNVLSRRTEGALHAMAGKLYSAEGEPAVLVQRVRFTQESPDLREAQVGLYRRVYALEVDYL